MEIVSMNSIQWTMNVRSFQLILVSWQLEIRFPTNRVERKQHTHMNKHCGNNNKLKMYLMHSKQTKTCRVFVFHTCKVLINVVYMFHNLCFLFWILLWHVDASELIDLLKRLSQMINYCNLFRWNNSSHWQYP